MKSIQTKFIALILGCVLLSSLVIGGAGIQIAHTVIDQDSTQIMNLLCSEKANELDALFSRIEQSVNTVSLYAAQHIEDLNRLKQDTAYQQEYITKVTSIAISAANNTDGALAVYIRFNPESFTPTAGFFWGRSTQNMVFEELIATDLSKYSATDMEHVGWYYVPVNQGCATWMEPYYNKNLGVEIISYVIPIYMENEVIGVVGMDIDYHVIEDIVNAIRVYDTGYAFLVNTQGDVVYHQEISMGTPMDRADISLRPVVEELKKGSSHSSLFNYVWKGQEKELSFRTLRNTMHLVVSAPTSEINASRNQLIIHSLTSLLIIAMLSVMLTILFTRRLIRPLKELNAAAKKIADGDLSITIHTKSKDEVGTLAESFQKTVNSLRTYMDYMNGLAYRDPLTGVKNKTAYLEAKQKLEERMLMGQPEFGIVVMDINGLKIVNDTFGHDLGDMLIMAACKLICKTFRHSPVYRIGGDEFVVLLEHTDLQQYTELLELFQKEMKESHDPNVSIARGIAIYDKEMDFVYADVFQRADDAMYRNKAAMKQHK